MRGCWVLTLGSQLFVVHGLGMRALRVDMRPTGGGRHRAVRCQGTAAVVGQGYLEMALSRAFHRLQPARHTPAFPVPQSSLSVVGAGH